MKIINETIDKVKELKKTKRKFLSEIITTILLLQGKTNFRNLSRYCSYHEKSISRNFKSIDKNSFLKINKEILCNLEAIETILAVDCSFIKKSGKLTYGKGKFFNSKSGKAEEGLEVSTLALIDVIDNSAYTIDIRQTPSISNESRVDFYSKQVKDVKDIFPLVKYVTGDGYYTKINFVNAVIDSNKDFIGKLRKDADLKYYYEGTKTGLRGAPKKYNGKVDLSNPNFSYVKDLEDGYKLYSKIVYNVRLKKKINIAYVTNGKIKNLYFSTDYKLSAEKIYKYYQSRFQIEFLFRDAKNHLGLEDCMSLDEKAMDFHFNICMSSLNFAKVEDKMNRTERKPFSIISYKRRLYNEKLIKLFLYKLEINSDFIINKNEYLDLLNYGVISA
jgi:hypothetical protein